MEQSPKVPRRELGRSYPVASFTKEEKMFYNKTVEQSKGFVCGYIVPGIHHPSHLMPTVLQSIHSIERKDALNDLGQRATNYFNIQEDKEYCFHELICVNSREVSVKTKVIDRMCEATVYYITFNANEQPRTPLRNFKAIILCYLDETRVQYCNFAEKTLPPIGNFVLLSDV